MKFFIKYINVYILIMKLYRLCFCFIVGYEGVENFMEILCDLLNFLMDKNNKVKIENEWLSRKWFESSEVGDIKKSKLSNGNLGF